jgi:glutathione synthase/RimK-type ligase-like ATP-grasp enzyme
MILIVTNAWEPTADRVIRRLTKMGQPWVRFNTNDFPTKARVSLGSEQASALMVNGSGKRIDLSAVRSAWLWKYGEYELPEGVSPVESKYIHHQCQTVMHSAYRTLQDRAFMLNVNERNHAANDKPRQLSLAPRLGLQIPPTLVTNSPEEAKAFCARHSQVAYKSIGLPVLFDKHGEAATPPRMIYTNILSEKDVSELEQLQWCPAILQAYVPKRFEVRVTIVGNQVFAAELHSQAHGATATDYRRTWNESVKISHRVHALPPKVAESCLAMTREFGLAYSAIDMIFTPEGEYVFLEMNPTGMYAWIEDATELPISDAIAAMLVRGRLE